VEADSGTVARWGQTQNPKMSPAPDTDVEEEEVDNKMEEGEEVMDIDDGIENLLLETSLSQQSDYGESQDLDSILRPLSDSQRAKEEELDRVDKRIKEEGEGATLEEGSQELVVAQATATPSTMALNPPGMAVLDNPPTLTYSKLCLEADFGWTGRSRLLAAGLSNALVDELLGSPRIFAVRLAPSVGQSRFYATPQEFCMVADCLFFNACAIGDAQEHAVVRRSLLELLKNCGLPWKLTSRHMLTALLNLGLNPVLQYGLSSDLACSQVKLPGASVKDECANNLPIFYLKHFAGKHEVDTETIKPLLGNTLNLIATLLTLPERIGPQPPSVSLLSMLAILGLDPVMIDIPLPSRYLTLILHSLLDLCPAASLDTFLQDMVEEVMTRAPRLLGHSSFHPHNVSHLCTLMPSSVAGCRLRRIFAYFGLQVGLRIQELDLPNEVSLSDLWSCLSTHRERWRTVSQKQHYVTRHLLALMDQVYSGELPPSSCHWKALRGLLGLLDEYRDKAPRLDTLNLDPTIVGEAAAELGARWTLALNAAENQANLSLQSQVLKTRAVSEF